MLLLSAEKTIQETHNGGGKGKNRGGRLSSTFCENCTFLGTWCSAGKMC